MRDKNQHARELLKSYLANTSKEQRIQAQEKYKALVIEGPTFEEYMHYVKGYDMQSYLYPMAYDIFGEEYPDSSLLANLQQSYYSPPPLEQESATKKDPSTKEGSFSLCILALCQKN